MPTPEFSSYPDRIHGGIIATLLDSAMAHALFADGIAGVTADCRIRYREKMKLYEPVHITGWVESVRLGVYRCRAEIHQADALVVWASAKFMAIENRVTRSAINKTAPSGYIQYMNPARRTG
jgi:acyl-coenzyme A thioesterase PaaI-like protein